jgi:hypothetical protein
MNFFFISSQIPRRPRRQLVGVLRRGEASEDRRGLEIEKFRSQNAFRILHLASRDEG